jgi:hypothetical protein
VRNEAVDDLELLRGAVLAGEAPEERLDQVVNEPGENARGLGGIEALDLVPPPFAPDLIERRLEATGDELFVEAWGVHKLIMNDEL